MTTSNHKPATWAELHPEGRTIFYDGDDPDGFRRQIEAEFGFDPAHMSGRSLFEPPFGLGFTCVFNDPCVKDGEHSTWNERHGWSFHCPPEHLDVIYASGRWLLGS